MAISTLEEIFEESRSGSKPEKETASSPAKDDAAPDPKPAAVHAVDSEKDKEPAPKEPKAAGTGAQDGPPPSHEDEPADADGRLKALRAERKRRQETEQKLQAREKAASELETKMKEIESRLSSATAPVHQPQPQHHQPQVPQVGPASSDTPPDPWLDPEGAMRAVIQQTENARFRDRVEMSQEMMRSRFTDYEDVEKVFREACTADPYLRSQLRQSSFPAKFAYEHGKRLQALQEIGPDPAAFRTKLEAEIRAKLEAEQAEKQPPAAPVSPSSAKPVPPPPPSLAGVTSAAPRKSAGRYEGPTPLEDILG